MKELPIGSEYHVPVLMEEVLDGLRVQSGQWYIDGTVGGGGHAEKILAAGGRVVGIDQDDDALAAAGQRLSGFVEDGSLVLVKANFRDIADVCAAQQISAVAGILLDLGVSSYQLNESERGFQFESAELDMRMDRQLPITAADLLARLGVKDLERIFVDLGEERYARHFAKVIDEERQTQPITSGQQLASLLYRVSPPPYRRGPIHPATRVFQALRLAVNAELDMLTEALPQAANLLAVGGRLVVISFHSLEDRIVKRFIQSRSDLEAMTKKPVMASPAEVAGNPRSRSAKLRVARKIDGVEEV